MAAAAAAATAVAPLPREGGDEEELVVVVSSSNRTSSSRRRRRRRRKRGQKGGTKNCSISWAARALFYRSRAITAALVINYRLISPRRVRRCFSLSLSLSLVLVRRDYRPALSFIFLFSLLSFLVKEEKTRGVHGTG